MKVDEAWNDLYPFAENNNFVNIKIFYYSRLKQPRIFFKILG
jgi:hypothetical protein